MAVIQSIVSLLNPTSSRGEPFKGADLASPPLVALIHMQFKRQCVCCSHRGSSSHLQSLDFPETPFGADGGGKVGKC